MVLRSSRSVQGMVSSGVVTNVYGDSVVDPNSSAWEGGIGQGFSGMPGGNNIGIQVAAALDPALSSLTSAAQEMANGLRQQAVARERENRFGSAPGRSGPGLVESQELFHQAAAIGAATAVQLAHSNGLLANAPPLYTPAARTGASPPPPLSPVAGPPVPEYRTVDGRIVNTPEPGSFQIHRHGVAPPLDRSHGQTMAEWDRLHPETPAPSGGPSGSDPVAGGGRHRGPGDVVYPDGSVAPAPGRPDAPSFQFPGSFGEGRGFRLADLRQGVASRVDRWVSEHAPRHSPPVMGNDGNWYRAGEEAATDELGVIKATPLTNMQRSIGNMRAAASEKARNFLGGLAEGQGPGEALNEAAPMLGKIAGGIGIAYAAGNQALNQAEQQRQANQRFQQVLGGSNAEGFTERAQQNLFRLGLRGTMSGQDAEMLYQGALDLSGGRGGRRTQIEGIGVDLYKNLGMSVQDTLAVLHQAVQGGNESLYTLAETLRDVTKHARAAGENAAEARQNFEKAYAATSQYITGTSAVAVAQAQTEALTPLGAQAGGVSFATDNNAIYQQAQAMGMTPNQFLAASAAPTGVTVGGQLQGANVANAGRYAVMRRYLTPLISSQGWNRINAFIKSHPNASMSSARSLAQQLMANNEIPSYNAVIQAIQAGGVNINGMAPMDAIAAGLILLFQDPGTVASNPDLREQQEFARTAQEGLGLSGEDQSALKDPGMAIDTAGAGAAALPGAVTAMAKRIGISDADKIKTVSDYQSRAFDDDRGDSGHKGSQDDYLRVSVANNAVSPVLEALVRDHSNKDNRFLVTDGNGNQVQVDEHGLITRFFNQAESDPGSIQVIAGPDAGSTLGEMVGMATYTNDTRSDAAAAETGTVAQSSKDLQAAAKSGDFDRIVGAAKGRDGVSLAPTKAQQDASLAKGGAFKIELSPETQRYFRVVRTMTDPTAAARSAGVPPNSQPTTEELTSGHGG